MRFHKLILTVDGQHQPIFKMMRKYETTLGRRNSGQGAHSSDWQHGTRHWLLLVLTSTSNQSRQLPREPSHLKCHTRKRRLPDFRAAHLDAVIRECRSAALRFRVRGGQAWARLPPRPRPGREMPGWAEGSARSAPSPAQRAGGPGVHPLPSTPGSRQPALSEDISPLHCGMGFWFLTTARA